MAMLLTRAAIVAISGGHERIDLAWLAQVDYHAPAERRRLFERTLA